MGAGDPIDVSPHAWRLIETLRDFLDERVDLEHAYAAVMATIPLLERMSDNAVENALRDADANLEEIQLLRWRSRRRKAAHAVVDALHTALHHWCSTVRCAACTSTASSRGAATGRDSSFAICL